MSHEILDRDPTPEEHELVQSGFWPKFRRVAAQLPFAEDLLAAYYAAMDPATPNRVRAVLIGALAYFVMPADMIPDVIAGLGFTDDAAVLTAALGALAEHIRPTHRERARLTLQARERHDCA